MALDFGPPLRQIFDALGQDATFVPAVGAPVDITILPAQPDAETKFGVGTFQTSSTVFEILTEDVASFTKGSDTIIFKGITYVVKNARIKDALKLVWLVDTYPQ